jgi:hypothetical protein
MRHWGGRDTRREAVVASAVLLGLAAAVYGWYVFNGGFTTDDWAHSALAHQMSAPELVEYYWEGVRHRPVNVVYVPLQHELLGTEPALHIAWTLVVAAGASALLYAVLRRLGFERRHALPVAALLLLFPDFDSTRLWPTANLTQLALVFCFAGLLLAMRGLREAQTPRSAVIHHGGAVLLYLLGVLTYEAVAPLVVLFGLVYLARTAPVAAARRWIADLAVVAAGLVWVATNTIFDSQPLGDQLDHARLIANQGATVLARSAMPFGEVSRILVLAALVGLVGAAVLLLRALPDDAAARPELRRWALVVVGGLLVAGAGWLMFVPADDYYSPESPGLGNRTNAIAAVGIVIAVYACAALAGNVLLATVARRRHAETAATAVFAALLLVGYALELRNDMRAWARAADREGEVLTRLDRVVGKPAPGTSIYTFGYPAFEAPGVPIYIASFDLTGAVKLHWDDPSLRAYPIVEGTSIACRADRLEPVGPGWSPDFGATYGRAVFVDLGTGRAEPIGSAKQCAGAVSRFRPGPLIG